MKTCSKCGKKYEEQYSLTEREGKLKIVEELAKLAFKGKRKQWIEFLGAEYGCEKINELTDEQVPKIVKALNEVIKNGKG